MRRFFISVIVGLVFLFNTAFVNAETLAANTVFNTAQIGSGIIKVGYGTEKDKKLKLFVEKSGKRITYDLKNDGTVESFSLQMGNGDYSVSVLENIEGNKYTYVSTENVKLDLTDQKEVFLNSVQNINWNDEMAAIKKARELTNGVKEDQDKINNIYNYIISNINYDFDKLNRLTFDYIPNIDSTLASNKGICYDYSSTFAAMLRSAGIPAKLVKGYSTNVNGYHAWNEVYNTKDNKWIIIDTTYDSQMKAANAKFKMEKESSEYTKIYEY